MNIIKEGTAGASEAKKAFQGTSGGEILAR
jgi:hypothetical protein